MQIMEKMNVKTGRGGLRRGIREDREALSREGTGDGADPARFAAKAHSRQLQPLLA